MRSDQKSPQIFMALAQISGDYRASAGVDGELSQIILEADADFFRNNENFWSAPADGYCCISSH